MLSSFNILSFSRVEYSFNIYYQMKRFINSDLIRCFMEIRKEEARPFHSSFFNSFG